MSRLVTCPEDGHKPGSILKDRRQISQALAKPGVRFEKWQTDANLPVNADQRARQYDSLV